MNASDITHKFDGLKISQDDLEIKSDDKLIRLTKSSKKKLKNSHVIPSVQSLLDLKQKKREDAEGWIYVNGMISKINKALFQVLKMGGPDREEFLRSPNQYEDDTISLRNKRSLLQLFLHSTRVLVELLHPMLHHAHMHDQNLQNINPSITDDKNDGKTSNPKGKKKKKCYLFLADTVYSITTVNACNNLKKDYYRVLNVFKNTAVVKEGNDLDKQITSSLIDQSMLWNKEESWNRNQTIQNTISLFTQNNDENFNNYMQLGEKMDKLFLDFVNLGEEASRAERANKLKNDFSNAIAQHFSGTSLYIYGSCANQLSLGKSFDVDLSLTTAFSSKLKSDFQSGKIKLETYTKKRNSHLFQIRNVLNKLSKVQFCFAIINARVPLLKGKAYIGKSNGTDSNNLIEFDICLMNDVAVANSSLINEYCNFGDTHKILLLIKAWVKTHSIGSAADGTLSSYSWMVMAIFYLQCIGYVPNLQNKNWFPQQGQDNATANNRREVCTQFVTFQQKSRKKWKKMMNSKIQKFPVSIIFFGFLKFYANVFPYGSAIVSIRNSTIIPKTVFTSCRLWRFCIEDPFETFDCCTPHDLGLHIDDKGQEYILNAFRMCLTKLESIFNALPDQHMDTWIDMLDYLNPKPISKKVKSFNRKNKEDNKKNVGQKKNLNHKAEGSKPKAKKTYVRNRATNKIIAQGTNQQDVKSKTLETNHNVQQQSKPKKFKERSKLQNRLKGAQKQEESS